MRLSEAIRLGSMLRPQVRGRFVSRLGTCALGAAIEAVDASVVESSWDPVGLSARFPMLSQPAPCPACSSQQTLFAVIMHLNDCHRWSRTQVADWVQELELPGGDEEPDGGPEMALVLAE